MVIKKHYYQVFVRCCLRQETAQMMKIILCSYHKETLILHLLHQCSALPPTGLALKVPSGRYQCTTEYASFAYVDLCRPLTVLM